MHHVSVKCDPFWNIINPSPCLYFKGVMMAPFYLLAPRQTCSARGRGCFSKLARLSSKSGFLSPHPWPLTILFISPIRSVHYSYFIKSLFVHPDFIRIEGLLLSDSACRAWDLWPNPSRSTLPKKVRKTTTTKPKSNSSHDTDGTRASFPPQTTAVNTSTASHPTSPWTHVCLDRHIANKHTLRKFHSLLCIFR